MEKVFPLDSGPDLAVLAEDSPAMLWRGNTSGRCVYLNARMREFWGLTAEQCATFDWSTSLLEEDHQAVFGPFARGMSLRIAFECEGRYRRSDGEIRILRTRARPYQDASDEFAGMIGVNEDITELRHTEQSLAQAVAKLTESAEHHRAVLDRLSLATSISGLAMSEHDSDLRYTWSHNVTGNPIGKTPIEAFGEDIGRPFEEILRMGLSTPQSQELGVELAGSTVWLAVQTAPQSRVEGAAGVVASALDITPRKQNEQKLEVLARELSHRVKNVFALVQAIVRQSARTGDVPAEFLETLDARLISLARAQDALLASNSESAHLMQLLSAQVAHLNGVHLTGPNSAVISAQVAPYVALAVHELGTNATKYGSLRESDGRVEISWSESDDGAVHLVWQEHGGQRPVPKVGSGFGTQLLTRIFSHATMGEASLEFNERGLLWRARVPSAATS
ncbi:MAG: PAS domain S-box protein [Hyphomicrobiales bacterium]|nr:MAG: PAS domain S-box protein [Hyphomicrobiales bacterium]